MNSTDSSAKTVISFRTSKILSGSVSVVCLLSGCGLAEWSSLHHQRLYDRYRLIANHELADGNFKSALDDLRSALRELELVEPVDTITRQRCELELGRNYLACGMPGAALERYARVDDGKLLAESFAGKGFCFLAMNEKTKAKDQFKKALDLYKLHAFSPLIKPFPLDACPSCCNWGLSLCDSATGSPIELTTDDGKSLPTECLTTRLILKRIIQPQDQPRASAGEKRDLHTSWSTLIQAGRAAAALRDFDKAERYFKSALSLIRRNGDSGVRTIESLDCLSTLYSSREQRDKALPYLQEALRLRRNKLKNGSTGLIDAIRRDALCQTREGHLESADTLMSEALKICRDSHREDQICARLHANCSELRLAQGRFADAEVEGKRSLRMFAGLPQANEYRVAVPNFMVAKSLIAQNRMAEARDYMQRAVVALKMPDVSDYIKLDILVTKAELSKRQPEDGSTTEAIRDANRFLRTFSSPRSTANQRTFSRLAGRLEKLERSEGR